MPRTTRQKAKSKDRERKKRAERRATAKADRLATKTMPFTVGALKAAEAWVEETEAREGWCWEDNGGMLESLAEAFTTFAGSQRQSAEGKKNG